MELKGPPVKNNKMNTFIRQRMAADTCIQKLII